jgi:adenine-specific DNA-methyltransferase
MVEHSLWLTLIKQRLEILRRLLSPDGSIWISIDDNECHYLKVVCDEVFGRGNFVDSIIWQKIYTVKNSARHFSGMHEYILVYAKNKDVCNINLLPRSDELNESYSNPDNDPRGDWTTNAIQARNFYSQGTYEIVSPNGKVFLPPTGTFWRVSKSTFFELEKEKRIWWGKTGGSVPRIKKFLGEANQGVVPATLWFHTDAGQNAEAKIEIRNLFEESEELFSTPKPEKLIEQILTLSTNPGDLILDSFLGSGTTAAVAHKMNRRWIGIELGEHCYTHCVPRLRKVVSGEDQGGISKAVDWKGGGGFKTYRLAPSLLKEDEHAMLRFNPDFTDDMVAEAVAKIEGFTFAPDPVVFWKQSRSSEHDYLLVTKIFVTAEWLGQLQEQMTADESLLLCCPAYGEGCERAFQNITLKKIPNAFMRKYQFGKDDYSLNVENVIGGNNTPESFEDHDFEENRAHPRTVREKKGKKPTDTQATLF